MFFSKWKRAATSACLVASLVVMASITGCGTANEQGKAVAQQGFATVTDDAGRTVTIPAKPQRIVPLSASFLEPLHALKAPVVARVSTQIAVPEEDKNLPEVGTVYNINMESVVAQKPDLVIVNKGKNEKFISSFESNHIPVIVLNMKTYDQVKHAVTLMGEVTGNKNESQDLLKQMDQKIADVQKKLPKEGKRIAIIYGTSQSVTVQLKTSIAGSIADMLGLKNIADGMTPLQNNPTSAPYSLEQIAAANPDVIFIATMGDVKAIREGVLKNIESNPAWKALSAVQAGHVYFLPQDQFLLSPGIQYPEAVEYMAKLAYPERF